MRLNEIASRLLAVKLAESELHAQDYGETRILSNINNIKSFLNIIRDIPIYKEEVEFLQDSPIYETSTDKIEVKEGVADQINSSLEYLHDSINSLRIVFSKLLPQSNNNSISIKLPEPTDLESLNKTMNTVQKYISQLIVNDTINGTVKINHWEFGSFWIELALGVPAAIALISSTAWSAAVISKKFNENKILEQTVRSMKIKNDSLDDVLEAQKKLSNQLIENEAQSILDEHFENNNSEQLVRIKGAIKEFAKLIQDGAEIHPSLMSPEKVQNLFPNYSKLDTITSKIKQIEDKSKHEEEK